MKALYIEKHGAIDDLKVSEVPRPSIGPNDVLVKVEAAGINPSDLVSVQGRFPGSVLPRIVGRDFAGTVVEGPADLIGTEVWGTGGDLGVSRNGTHAEYLAIPRQAVAPRPKNLSIEAAAAAGVPFVTAFSALVRLGKLQKDEWVIVSGAAGAVGQAAIQIAHSKGAQVIALVKDGNERNSSMAGQVEAAAQSDQNNLNEVVRAITDGRGANLALNGVGSTIFGNLLEALAIGGRQVIYSVAAGKEVTLDLMAFYKNQFTLLGLDTQKFNAIDCAAILNELTPLFESGALKAPPFSKRFPLSDAAQAYSLVAAGRSGKVVLTMAS
jgi:NADPH:quinone reductase-like Zn-dependent oxidoreductase